MANPTTQCEEIASRGQEYYDRFLRAKVEPEHKGKFLVLEVETGDYELDESELAALDRAEAKHPDTVFYTLRVGYPAAHRVGARFAGR